MGRFMLWAIAVACIAESHGALASEPNSPLASEPSNALEAEATFQAARALLEDKRYADACPKFEQSQRLDPALGTLLALAYCQELSGLLATSWTNYLAAAQLAEREGQGDRQSAATERARAISTRVSKLTVVVPPQMLSLPGFRLLRDGVEFERASFGMAVPMDGGTHAFQASAPGRVPWVSSVTVLIEHDQKTLILPVLDLEPLPNRAPVSPSSPPVSDDHAAHDSELALRRVSLVMAAASVIGLGVGTGFALSAKSKNDRSNEEGHCANDACDASGTRLRNDALSAARVSTWSFVASGVLAAGSVTLYLTANSLRSPSNHGARLQGNVALGAPSVSFATSF